MSVKLTANCSMQPAQIPDKKTDYYMFPDLDLSQQFWEIFKCCIQYIGKDSS